jgi:hypothetical protein
MGEATQEARMIASHTLAHPVAFEQSYLPEAYPFVIKRIAAPCLFLSLAFPVSAAIPAPAQSTPAVASDAKYDDKLGDCVVTSYVASASGVEQLTLLNQCKVRAHVYYFSTGPDSGGAYLNPGESRNTHLPHDRVDKAGGFALYACPAADVPVDAEDKFTGNKKPVVDFRCKRD